MKQNLLGNRTVSEFDVSDIMAFLETKKNVILIVFSINWTIPYFPKHSLDLVERMKSWDPS